MKVSGKILVGVTGTESKNIFAELDPFGRVPLYFPDFSASGDRSNQDWCDITFVSYQDACYQLTPKGLKQLIDHHYLGAYQVDVVGELEYDQGSWRLRVREFLIVGDAEWIADLGLKI